MLSHGSQTNELGLGRGREPLHCQAVMLLSIVAFEVQDEMKNSGSHKASCGKKGRCFGRI